MDGRADVHIKDAYRRLLQPSLESEFRTLLKNNSDEEASKAFKKAKFRVVMMHISMFYSGDAYGTLDCREMFKELCNKYKVDTVISGHTQRYGV
ncbi:MAG: metallophosphoesterase [Chitinophagaceae bacterium]